MNSNKKLSQWVKEMAELCQPDKICWCDGSIEENERLLKEMVDSGREHYNSLGSCLPKELVEELDVLEARTMGMDTKESKIIRCEYVKLQ
ncbi:hypothetical protein HYG86_12575 [Alkalicella caledoniensis]|uniref:Phosphoenolpyruvate carboxykinase GTP-utilising N-terminal domain-containing protein n=1 Tax=Alkalicella caledoniensis TaxID=2731377 RepID=A0A7G9WA32_ALKCA|nr:hypothetical protein [Alkalicella caledoniensis]QNO15544.1 hypothetical protein HYG86_12575 [Alkalicella caledoniensis]